jgi:hypothetical protein
MSALVARSGRKFGLPAVPWAFVPGVSVMDGESRLKSGRVIVREAAARSCQGPPVRQRRLALGSQSVVLASIAIGSMVPLEGTLWLPPSDARVCTTRRPAWPSSGSAGARQPACR